MMASKAQWAMSRFETMATESVAHGHKCERFALIGVALFVLAACVAMVPSLVTLAAAAVISVPGFVYGARAFRESRAADTCWTKAELWRAVAEA